MTWILNIILCTREHTHTHSPFHCYFTLENQWNFRSIIAEPASTIENLGGSASIFYLLLPPVRLLYPLKVKTLRHFFTGERKIVSIPSCLVVALSGARGGEKVLTFSNKRMWKRRREVRQTQERGLFKKCPRGRIFRERGIFFSKVSHLRNLLESCLRTT